MTLRAHKYLLDVQLAIKAVESFVRDTPDFAAYQADHKTRSAVERQLAIVGEDINHLRREWPEVNLSNTKQMIDFRNRLIHSYDNINDAIVWVIVQKHLPELKTEINTCLQALPPV